MISPEKVLALAGTVPELSACSPDALLKFASLLEAEVSPPPCVPNPDFSTDVFAIVLDRSYEGEGPSLAYLSGPNYEFADGDCFDREGDTLDGLPATFFSLGEMQRMLFQKFPLDLRPSAWRVGVGRQSHYYSRVYADAARERSEHEQWMGANAKPELPEPLFSIRSGLCATSTSKTDNVTVNPNDGYDAALIESHRVRRNTLDDAIAEIGMLCQQVPDASSDTYIALQSAMKSLVNLKRNPGRASEVNCDSQDISGLKKFSPDLQRLARFARAASAGPWEFAGIEDGFATILDSTGEVVLGEYGPGVQNARFIAEADPVTILHLIEHFKPDGLTPAMAGGHGANNASRET